MSFFTKQAAIARRAMLRFGAGLLAVAGVGGLGYMIVRTMKAIDTTAKLAAALQISTEALKGLELAATISGASFEIVQKSLEIMVRRLAESKLGIGEAKRGLDEMGLSAQTLINVGTEEAFMRIADGISKIPTAAGKAFAAYTIFGRQGVKLINLFKDGRIGLENFRKEAEKLGMTFSAVDAAKIEEANDAISRARFAIQGIVQAVTIELAPVIETAATSFKDWITSSKQIRENIIGVIEPTVIAIAFLKDLFDVIAGSLQWVAGQTQLSFGIIVAGIGQITAIISKNIGGMIEEVGKTSEEAGLGNMKSAWQKIKSGSQATATFGTADYFAEQERNSARLAQQLEEQAAARAKDAAAMAAEKAQAEALFKVFEAGTKIAEQMATPLEKYETRLTELNDLLDADAISMETFARATEKARDALTGKLFDTTPMEEYEAQITKLNDLVVKGIISWPEYGRAYREAREKLEGSAADTDATAGSFAGAGNAKIIREAFVSVSGLAMGTQDPTLSKMDEQRMETQKTNQILLDIRNEGGLS